MRTVIQGYPQIRHSWFMYASLSQNGACIPFLIICDDISRYLHYSRGVLILLKKGDTPRSQIWGHPHILSIEEFNSNLKRPTAIDTKQCEADELLRETRKECSSKVGNATKLIRKLLSWMNWDSYCSSWEIEECGLQGSCYKQIFGNASTLFSRFLLTTIR